MAHLVFFILHALAFAFVAGALLVTIPLHLIYSVISSGKAPKPNRWTHVRCPDCRELVLKDASVCKHCGCKLVPQ